MKGDGYLIWSVVVAIVTLLLLGGLFASVLFGAGPKSCPAGSERVWVTIQDGYKCRVYVGGAE